MGEFFWTIKNKKTANLSKGGFLFYRIHPILFHYNFITFFVEEMKL